MTLNFYKIWSLQEKLFYRYSRLQKEGKDCKKSENILWSILGNSIPIVYPDWGEWEFEYDKLKRSRKQRKKRVKTAIKGIFDAFHEEKLFFLTFTFSERAMSRKANTRRQYVIRYLNKYCLDYIANQDFGDKTNREHYHAVVACDYVHTDFVGGHVHFERIKVRNSSRLANYLDKLTNHAVKDGAGKLLRKRGLVEFDEFPF